MVSLFLQICPKAGKWTPPQWELLFSSSKLLIFRINQNDNRLYSIRTIMGELFLGVEIRGRGCLERDCTQPKGTNNPKL